jgi:hypothetical membrane protein
VMSAAIRARIGTSAGILGALVILGASVAAALAYSGTKGEAYSFLNHWVSELGEVGVSELSIVFNLGLIVGGFAFAVFMTMLASSGTGRLRFGYGVIGVIAGIAGLFVGVFPMGNIPQHRVAALTFFNLGWIAVALASLDFVRRPDGRFPRWLSVVGGLTVAAFIGFLASVRLDTILADNPLGVPPVRPELWIVPTLEWAVIVGILAWTLLVALAWRRAR